MIPGASASMAHAGGAADAESGGSPAWHALPPDRVIRRLETAEDGLPEDEARRRLAELGPNMLEVHEPAPAWRILLDQFRSLVVLLLVAAMAVAFLLGDLLEAGAIGLVLLLNAGIGFLTEFRARRAMEALLQLQPTRARVVRDGTPREVDAADLVPGDVVELREGESVPADARLLAVTELQVNEAPLTGESLPVMKRVDAVPDPETPLPERESMVYKGTGVAAGGGRAVVVSTGAATEVGRIGELVGGIEEERTPLERRLDALGRRLVWITLGVAGVVTLLGVLQGVPAARMLEVGIALAIAAVPEGLPAVATIALAVGLRRMARRHALIRRLPAVEALGSSTVVCTDKTGTLTAGEMTVTLLWSAGREVEVTGVGYAPEGEFRIRGATGGAADGGPAEAAEGGAPARKPVDPARDAPLRAALEVGALANRAEVTEEEGRWRVRGDPTEGALLVAAHKAGIDREALLRERPAVGEVPFSSERMLMATFHRAPGREGAVACVKGAPHQILERSSRLLDADGERELGPEEKERLERVNEDLAARGLRVLALATAEVDAPEEDRLEGLTFLGFAGILDPPAEGVKETIRRFRDAGVRTVMLTGDQRPTAEAVARALGVLTEAEETVDGRELRRASPEALAGRVGRIGTFSRIGPEDKLRVVSALQAGGEIVAMLGDGVNDAAALRKADVGVAMGIRGTDVAREAADVVLQDDRFPTLAAAVEEGRVIFDNIRKFVFYLFSCNAAEVLTLFVASLAGLPLPLLPLQILWLNLVTDTFPALALALEPADREVMRRPPRDPGAAILSRSFVRALAFYAGLISLSTLTAFVWGLERPGGGYEEAVTLGFMTLAFAQIFHLGNARSRTPVTTRRAALSNPYAVGAVAFTVGLQLAALYLPPLAEVLRVVPLAPADWLVVVPLAAIPALVGQGIRTVRRRG